MSTGPGPVKRAFARLTGRVFTGTVFTVTVFTGTSTLWLAGCALLTGCEERTLTDRDCLMIQERIEAAWGRDAVAAQKLAETDDLGGFIGAEGDRLAQRWGQRCNALVGQPISEEELTCLRNAQTIDDFEECRR